MVIENGCKERKKTVSQLTKPGASRKTFKRRITEVCLTDLKCRQSRQTLRCFHNKIWMNEWFPLNNKTGGGGTKISSSEGQDT